MLSNLSQSSDINLRCLRICTLYFSSFSSPEPTILLACGRDQELWLTALAGPDFLSMRRVFVSYSQQIRFARFDGKSENRGLPVLDQDRALDPCQRPEGSWALVTRMIFFKSIADNKQHFSQVSFGCAKCGFKVTNKP